MQSEYSPLLFANLNNRIYFKARKIMAVFRRPGADIAHLSGTSCILLQILIIVHYFSSAVHIRAKKW